MQQRSGPLGRGELGHEPLKSVGATSQPLGFPAPLARLSIVFLADRQRSTRRASGTGHAHRLSIRGSSEIRHWFKWLSLPHLLRSAAPAAILAGCPPEVPQAAVAAALHKDSLQGTVR